ncbi:MAG TPA: GtrA family protein [Rhodocyclaceae bacterium]|nr:GtrA family protein [Rhodocyclaceae bacterium]
MDSGRSVVAGAIRDETHWPALRALGFSFVKYVAVGGVAFAADFGTFSATLSSGAHYQLATVYGFIIGIIVNYALCVTWVWRGSQARSLRDITVFTLVGIGGLALTALGMWLGVDQLHCPERATRIVMAAVVLIWNFGLRRLFVFFR